MADGLVVCGLSERVQAHGQGVGWKIGNQIDFGLINLPQQSPGIVFPAQLVSSERGPAGFGAVGDELEGVDKMLALGEQSAEAVRLR